MFPLFFDRREAGKRLAAAVAEQHPVNPIVLALPRGGVPVAIEVAEALNAPLDLLLVRKLGAPYQGELAIGAIVDGADPQIVLNDEIVAELAVPQSYIDEVARRELAVIEQRRRKWLAGRAALPLAGRTVIIVDDGIATGATIKAGILAARRQGPERIIIAAPVAPRDTVKALGETADEVIVLATPHPFVAIGRFYDDFTQVEDADVTAMLEPRKGSSPSARLP